MSLGNLKTNGQGGKNTPWQTSVVQLLVSIKNSIIIANGAYTESNQTITGTTMTLPHTPTFVYGVFLNGQRLTSGVDYTMSANVVTFVSALSSDMVSVVYKF